MKVVLVDTNVIIEAWRGGVLNAVDGSRFRTRVVILLAVKYRRNEPSAYRLIDNQANSVEAPVGRGSIERTFDSRYAGMHPNTIEGQEDATRRTISHSRRDGLCDPKCL